ncbi:PAS and ANTAR domain-containing protein [Hoyosella sp. YIM 151337]|uniref:PAS and ANTAR domain-containing protein n=1 Tax=Hoyosella sp. YIM 151337 TaxID=2992742 RepID=UPI002236AC96|nr:PAS and ANTAR domain-containing protein [Hoyosella sp. YIM 151337]MCW4352006.1 PAS and ANTAR domain-containing protein [Hoyosella sp. YIM 151337]
MSEAVHAVGSFRYWPKADRWEWSDEVAEIHGYAPGTVEPTTELVMQHKHPDDVKAVADLLERTRKSNVPFSGRYRIIDTSGRVRYVVVAGRTVYDEKGEPDGTEGFYIDVTDTWVHDMQVSADEAVAEVVKSRAAIDQVKGMLMLVYRIDANRAFEVLRWRSQSTNMKISKIARRVRRAAIQIELSEDSRSAFDDLLLTVHERRSE